MKIVLEGSYPSLVEQVLDLFSPDIVPSDETPTLLDQSDFDPTPPTREAAIPEAPPAPIAPVAPVAEPPANAGNGAAPPENVTTLDADGVPWDARIHSDAATKLSTEGRWKKRRGVDAKIYRRVMKELQAGAPGEDEVVPLPADPVAPPVAPATPPAAPPAPPTAAAPIIDLRKVMDRTAQVLQNAPDQPVMQRAIDQMNEYFESIGLEDAGGLAQRPDLWLPAFERLGDIAGALSIPVTA